MLYLKDDGSLEMLQYFVSHSSNLTFFNIIREELLFNCFEQNA